MREIADWIVANLTFDRLYYYASDRPVHISYGPNPAGQFYLMTPSTGGRLMPRPLLPGP